MTDFISDIESVFGAAQAKAIRIAGKVVMHEGQFDKAKNMKIILKGRRW